MSESCNCCGADDETIREAGGWMLCDSCIRSLRESSLVQYGNPMQLSSVFEGLFKPVPRLRGR